MKHYISFIYEHSTWSVGNGKSIYFWIDKLLYRTITDH